MVNTAVTLLILFLLSACLLLESAHTDKTKEIYPQTEYEFKKIDDDWVVDLSTKDQKSIDVSEKSFLVEFSQGLEVGSAISWALETGGSIGDKNDRKIDLHQASFHIVVSERQVWFTPISRFPKQDLVHSRRLIIHVQTTVEVSSVFLIDAPFANAKQAIHRSKSFSFYEEMSKLRALDHTLVLDVSTPDSFKTTFWDSPMFQPKSLNMDFTPFSETPKRNSPTCSMYNNKFVPDGANPNARFITLLSHEMSRVYSNILSHPMYLSFTDLNTHSLFIGRMIGMAIVNHLPVDIPFTKDIFKALTEDPIPVIEPPIVNRHLFGPDAQKRAQIDALCCGVWSVVPRELLKRFDADELGWIITGRPAELIHINFLKMWVKYERGMSEETPLIKWFWTYVASLNQQKDLNKLWEIITGSPRLSSYINNEFGYEFMIVSKSLKKTYNVAIDSMLPVGIYVGADEPPLLYIPPYSCELVLQNNFNLVMG